MHTNNKTPNMPNPASFPLFIDTGTDAVPDRPALVGGRCVCGYVFFPMQTYGCEKCGRFGNDLKEVRLSGRGRLLAFAQVHLHARPYPEGAVHRGGRRARRWTSAQSFARSGGR